MTRRLDASIFGKPYVRARGRVSVLPAETWCCGFGVCLRNLRDLREILGFLLWQLIEYSYVIILSQITQIYADKQH